MLTWTILILIFCHIFIQVLWTATSRGGNYLGFIKTWKNVYSVPIVLFEGTGFAQVLLITWFSLPTIYSSTPAIQILGLIISITGVLLASWAKIEMGNNWGRPAQHDRDKQTKLVTSAPFNFTRNPIYVGLFMLFTGQQIALGSSAIILSLFFAVTIRNSVVIEEKLLENYFSKAYIDYKNRVPRYL